MGGNDTLLHPDSGLAVRAARLGDVPAPVRHVEPVPAHALARGRGVHEFAVADVDPDVGVLPALLVEEHEVAGLKLGELDALGGDTLIVRAARQLAAGASVAVLNPAVGLAPP